MKHFYKMIIFATVAMLVVFYVYNMELSDRNNHPEMEISPYSNEYKIDSEVFYYNNKYLLVKEGVSMTVYMSNYIEALFERLKESKWNQNLKPPLDNDVELLGYRIDDSTLTIDVSQDIFNTELWKNDKKDTLVYAIVNSYCALDTFEEVVINVDGVNISEFIPKNKMTYSFDDAYIDNYPSNPYEIVFSFLNYIHINRYDLAYSLTTESNEYEYYQTNFENRVKEVFSAKMNKGYYISYVSKEKKDFFVLVTFYEEDAYYPDDYSNYKFKVVKMVDQTYKIVF